MAEKYSYQVPAETICVEQEIKKSKFITRIARAKNKEEAVAFIRQIQEEFADARHNCWAYVAGDPASTVEIGMSDDGEPQGTAGKPMLNVLKHKGIGEIVAVVTRYFGGIKLGAGGLVRAYSGAVQQGVDALELIECVACKTGEVRLDYVHESTVRHLLNEYSAEIIKTDYQGMVTMLFDVPQEKADILSERITNHSKGQLCVYWK